MKQSELEREKSEHFFHLALAERHTGPQVVISKRKITAPKRLQKSIFQYNVFVLKISVDF